jgi:hypothetical protein
VLIVEGADLLGKTTLVEQLLQGLSDLGHIPDHFGLLPEGWDYGWDYVGRMNRKVVMDRLIMSELVYGTVVRDGPRISPERYRWLDGQLRLRGAFTVVLVGSMGLVNRRFAERSDRVYDLDMVQDVNQGFKGLVRGDEFRDYRPDWDMRWELDFAYPWIRPDAVQVILDQYRERWDAVQQVRGEQPAA